MTTKMGTSGLILNESLLWERGRKGRTGYSMPASDVPAADLDAALAGDGPDFPDLSEVDVVRHFTRLSTWNFGVDTGMYPLGSCTMKYNPKTNERQSAIPGLSMAHPLLPMPMAQGAMAMMHALELDLAEITGMDAVSLQPAAGAHGELTGMLVIHAYHESRGDQRTKILIPDTAHGTNPASAALCGYKPVPVVSNEKGVLSPEATARLGGFSDACHSLTAATTVAVGKEEALINGMESILR